MSKIIGIANSCEECPNRHYYSAGTHECLKVPGPEYLAADGTIPAWCPLADHPANTIAALTAEAERLRADAERYRWLRDEANRSYVEFGVYGGAVISAPSADHLDEEVDAARSQSEEQKQ